MCSWKLFQMNNGQRKNTLKDKIFKEVTLISKFSLMLQDWVSCSDILKMSWEVSFNPSWILVTPACVNRC